MLGAALSACIILAGCGSAHETDPTKAAATCLRNALANEALDPKDTNCGDATAAHVLDQGGGMHVTVTCTHRDANEYICDVKVPTAEGISLTGVHGGFYDVVYDGRSITFSPA